MLIPTIRLFAVLPVAALFACAPADRDAREGDTAGPATSAAPEARVTNVRVVNAMPGTTGLDLFADDQREVTNVEFRSVSQYEQLPEGIRTFKVVTAGAADTAALAENTDLTFDGRYYTVIAVGSARGENAELEVVRDDEPVSDQSRARLRVVNAARNVDDIDVLVEGSEDAVVSGLGFGDDAASAEVVPGTVTLLVRRAGQQGVVHRIRDVNLVAGRTLTLVLTHPSATSRTIEVIAVPDQIGQTPAGAGTTGGTDTGTQRDTSRR